MYKVAILIPTFKRASRIPKIAENIKLSTNYDCFPLFIVDNQDPDSKNVCMDNGLAHLVSDGHSYAAAINDGFRYTQEHYLFAGADDLIFHDGWLEKLMEKKAFHKNGLVFGTNDLLNTDVLAGNHATHYLFQRSYIDIFGGTLDNSSPVLYEGYDHNYTDREFIDLARQRNVFFPCLESVVEHVHYEKHPSVMDDTYRKTRARIRQDRLSYQARIEKYL